MPSSSACCPKLATIIHLLQHPELLPLLVMENCYHNWSDKRQEYHHDLWLIEDSTKIHQMPSAFSEERKLMKASIVKAFV
jgi:hypothetical protein